MKPLLLILFASSVVFGQCQMTICKGSLESDKITCMPAKTYDKQKAIRLMDKLKLKNEMLMVECVDDGSPLTISAWVPSCEGKK